MQFDKDSFEDLLKRRFFYAPSFEEYGGIAGLYDYGPMGCALKTNIINIWRRHFVLEEGMFEVDCTALTPYQVLKSSGHVDRFSDFMVRDMKTGECHRADHLLSSVLSQMPLPLTDEIKTVLSQLNNYKKQELINAFKKYDIKSPLGNKVSEPVEFNMMFQTHIGPTSQQPCFLRPETAQGIFLCFRRLYEFNGGKLPLAGAQIGKAFRNEISPRSGLLRVREFEMAEIEHFVNPYRKTHAKFHLVSSLVVSIYSAHDQMLSKEAKQVSLGTAVKEGIINNETLGYFLGRIFLFMKLIGVDTERMRFRQHMTDEMAHYASDCWDTELLTSYGWIECVGCADRSCYDLEQHSKATGVPFVATEYLEVPIQIDVLQCIVDKSKIGKQFKSEAKAILQYFTDLKQEEIAMMGDSVTIQLGDRSVVVPHDMFTVGKKTQTMHERKFTPAVIEPSFGIGRIIYALLEHSFSIRPEDKHRTLLRLLPSVAPIKCAVLPLSNQEEFTPLLKIITDSLTRAGITFRLDDSSAVIGRRYARTDEIAIPFAITVDFQSVIDNTVTLRERDSMKQIRLNINMIVEKLNQLLDQSV